MLNIVYEFNGVRLLECTSESGPIRNSQDAIDLIGAARSHEANVVIVPAEQLEDDFFRLRTGIAGEIIQKFVTYGLHLVILGNISRHLNDSSALRDLVREANQGTQCWFITDRDELRRRFQSQPRSDG